MTQTSLDMLRSWRGNCDVQVFIYEAHPEYPDPDEIARVTDYTVGYACKGGQTLKEERDQVVSFVKS